MRRLREFAPMMWGDEMKRLTDVEGQNLTVNDVKFREGNYGEYAVIYAETEDGKFITVATGASLVVDALHRADTEKAFPLAATFRKRGRVWIIE